jgi:hypothetical protein
MEVAIVLTRRYVIVVLDFNWILVVICPHPHIEISKLHCVSVNLNFFAVVPIIKASRLVLARCYWIARSLYSIRIVAKIPATCSCNIA